MLGLSKKDTRQTPGNKSPKNMNDFAACFSDVSHVIQLALAPAFLLTGIAGMLNVMTGRLARIIDRGRYLSEQQVHIQPTILAAHAVERDNLERRRYLASAAITACTLSALLVCLVIAALFVKAMLNVEIKWVVGFLFTASTLILVIGLGYFLREVHLATKTVRILLPDSVHSGNI
jgi:hypothetical protein